MILEVFPFVHTRHMTQPGFYFTHQNKQKHFVCVCVCETPYRKQDHRYGQNDGHQNSDPNTQDESVQRVHPTVGMKELCLSVLWCTHTHTRALIEAMTTGCHHKLGLRCFLTVEGQITKYGREQIHDEHAEDGNVANVLHSSPGGAAGQQITVCQHRRDVLLRVPPPGDTSSSTSEDVWVVEVPTHFQLHDFKNRNRDWTDFLYHQNNKSRVKT